jgi:hypothetical protein
VTKRIGVLSFGHGMPFPHSQARPDLDVLLQSIDLEVAAESSCRLRLALTPIVTARSPVEGSGNEHRCPAAHFQLRLRGSSLGP